MTMRKQNETQDEDWMLLLSESPSLDDGDDDPLAIEAEKSARLHHRRAGRQLQQQQRRRHLSSHAPPPVQETTQHGMMIDAGSQGSRLHVYEFTARVLQHSHEIRLAVRGEKLSVPTTDTAWTDRLQPGLDTFAFVEDDADMVSQVAAYLEPLLRFAKAVLAEKKDNWGRYPIYLKATGGLRTLPRPYRIRLIQAVRQLFHDPGFNPFFFRDE